MTTTFNNSGQWENVHAARSFLSYLVNPLDYPFKKPTASPQMVAKWLIQQELGPLAYKTCQSVYPELVPFLQTDFYSALAENSLHFKNLHDILDAFARVNIPSVLLKGAALAQTVYTEQTIRTMSDIDIWVRANRLPKALEQLHRLGFQTGYKASRPPKLQALSNGEVQLYRPKWQGGLVEIQLGPLSGWWLKRTAVIDIDGIWRRKQPLGQSNQLAPEDAILQSAVHLSVNHQFGMSAVRHLVDMALIAHKRGVDWEIVAQRAKIWRIQTPVYLSLLLLTQLIDLPDVAPVLSGLQPSSLRTRLLSSIISPQKILNPFLLNQQSGRFLLLLLLVDRPQDMLRLVGRTLWPEKSWLAARYPEGKTNWQHLRSLILTRNP